MIRKAFQLVIEKSKQEKRLLSPDQNYYPYATHMLIVFEKLIEMGVIDEEILCAGILHDIIEDTDINLDFLQKEFNKNVRDIVDLCTKKKDFNSNSKSDLAEYYFKILKPGIVYSDYCRKSAMYIKVADRLTNLIGLSFTDKDDKKKFYILEIEEYFMPMSKEIGYEKQLLNAINYILRFKSVD